MQIGPNAKLTQDQLTKLIQFNTDINTDTVALAKQTREDATKEAEKKLQTDWGNDYEANVKLAEKAVTVLGGDEMVQVLETLGLTRNPTVVKLFHTIAKKIGEDSLIVDDPKVDTGGPKDSTGQPRLTFPSMGDKAKK